MSRLTDLRFVIGLFFIAVGLLLMGYSFINTTPTVADTMHVNLYSGLAFLAFGLLMVLMSEAGRKKILQEQRAAEAAGANI